jgi:methionine-rich copper-binding protein CopC
MAVTLTVVLIFGAHVAAHSSLGARNPRENQIVAKMPKDISLLVLDEGVGNERDDFVRVWDSKGQNIA